jgi:hypothetical protein
MMRAIHLFLSKLARARDKTRGWIVGPHLQLAILALVLFGWAYLVVGKAVIALEFAQGPSGFVP